MPVLFRDRTRPDTEHPLYGVGGWLAIFLGIVAFQALIVIVMLPGRLGGLGSVSVAALEAFPILWPLLILEALYPLAFIAAVPVGTWFTLRRNERAPTFWGWFVLGVFAYGLADFSMAQIFLRQLALHLPAVELHATRDRMFPALLADVQSMLWAGIWTWYWKDSERVHVTFGRNTWARETREPAPDLP